MQFVTQLNDETSANFYQNCQEQINQIGNQLIFFTNQLAKSPDQIIDQQLTASQLTKYQQFIEDIRIGKKYVKSDAVEEVLHLKGQTGRSAFVRLFDETMAGLEFTFNGKQLTASEIFDYLQNPDPELRKKAAKSVGKSLKQNIKLLAFITNILAKDKAVSEQIRGFEHPLKARNLSNLIEDEIVDLMCQTVKANYRQLSHRYFALKAKKFGLNKLPYWDRNAPYPKASNLRYSSAEAQSIVVSAYADFSPEMAAIIQRFFAENWLDVGPKKGKDSGAFAHPATPKAHPFILLNFQGKLRDIMTLAHELGHGVHQMLAAKQGYLLADTPLTLAETASIFGEELTFEKLLKEVSDEDKFYLLTAKIEDQLNTIVRQIAFHYFELNLHQARQKGELSIKEIGQIWLKTQQESLGKIIQFDNNYQYFWSYIPHFIHSPFYVYAYAFGNVLVNSLFNYFKTGNDQQFREKYLNLLKAGGSARYDQLLKPFGFNLKEPSFWQNGLDLIKQQISQAEALA